MIEIKNLFTKVVLPFRVPIHEGALLDFVDKKVEKGV